MFVCTCKRPFTHFINFPKPIVKSNTVQSVFKKFLLILIFFSGHTSGFPHELQTSSGSFKSSPPSIGANPSSFSPGFSPSKQDAFNPSSFSAQNQNTNSFNSFPNNQGNQNPGRFPTQNQNPSSFNSFQSQNQNPSRFNSFSSEPVNQNPTGFNSFQSQQGNQNPASFNSFSSQQEPKKPISFASQSNLPSSTFNNFAPQPSTQG